MHPAAADVFRHRVELLAAFLDAPTRLGANDAAAALRVLLIDDTPLLHLVNRIPRVPLRFVVAMAPGTDETTMKATHAVVLFGAALSPRYAPQALTRRELRLDAFLQYPVFYTAWRKVTVKDLILWAANEAGGVHYDPKPNNHISLILETLVAAGEDPERPRIASAIMGITAVTLDAVQPVLLALDLPGDTA